MTSNETQTSPIGDNPQLKVVRRYTVRSIIVFVFITIVGPHIGTLWLISFVNIAAVDVDGIAAFASQGFNGIFETTRNQLTTFPSKMLQTTPVTYFFGGVQALAVAVWMAGTVSKKGWIGFWRSGFAAVSVSLAVATVFVVPPLLDGTIVNGIPGRLTILTILGVLSVLSAMTCQIILALSRVIRRPIVL